MPEPRAHRTLVKSPPELWAEISDLDALTRHLGEFGEIRITRLEPETTVAWEGDRARGTVHLEPSGWGTKVTLTAELEEAVPEPVAAEPEPEPVAAELQPPEPEPEPLAAEPEPEPEPLAAEPEPFVEPEPVAEPEPLAAEPAPAEEPRAGFFARLFGLRRKPERAGVAEVAAPAEPEPQLEPVAAAPEPEPEPIAEATEPEPEPVAAARHPLDGDRAQAILTGVLDDLGSAHHRPFSRG
jgi:hypothetical protein